MTRDELLDRAKGCIGWAGGNNYLAQPLPSIAVSLEAIACILLAREIGEGEVVKQAEAEAEQMVAAQMEDELAAAKARIRELEEAIKQHRDTAHNGRWPCDAADDALYAVLDKR